MRKRPSRYVDDEVLYDVERLVYNIPGDISVYQHHEPEVVEGGDC